MGEKIVVLIPTYNEKENIASLVPEILVSLPSANILVVDDNSPDGTQDVVREMMKKYPSLQLFAREKKEGLGKAYTAAMKHVLKDLGVKKVFTMDADGSHSAEYLQKIYETSNNADLVVGSRYVQNGGIENWEMWRFVLSKYGNLYARILTGLPIHDLTAGFMCINADHLRKIDLDSIGASGYAYLMDLKFALVHSSGARAKEVPIIFRTRREGESKISRHIIGEGLKTPLRLFLKRWK